MKCVILPEFPLFLQGFRVVGQFEISLFFNKSTISLIFHKRSLIPAFIAGVAFKGSMNPAEIVVHKVQGYCKM